MEEVTTQTDAQVSKPVHPFWQHFSKKTLGLILALLLITGGLLYLAIREEQPLVKLATAPTPTPSPAHATLALIPETSTSSAIHAVDVVIQGNQNKISGAQLSIAYDPTILSNVTLKQGSYFTNPVVLFNTVDKVNGRISYVVAIGLNASQATGSGTIATISYTLLPTTSSATKISFLPKTEVTQQGIAGSVLKRATDLTIPLSSTPTGY